MFILKQIELFMQWCKCGVYKPVIRCHSEVWNFRNKFCEQISRVKFDMIVIFYYNNITNCWFHRRKCSSYAWYCTKNFCTNAHCMSDIQNMSQSHVHMAVSLRFRDTTDKFILMTMRCWSSYQGCHHYYYLPPETYKQLQ